MKITVLVAQKTIAVFVDISTQGFPHLNSHDRIAVAGANRTFKPVHRIVIEIFLHRYISGA